MKVPSSLGASLYWFEQRLRGRSTIKERLEWLRHTQHLSPAEARKLQFEKLHRLIEHAYYTVPYYRGLMQERGLAPKDFGCQEDLRKLPVLSRQRLRASQDSLLSSAADRATLQTNFSSGSTGLRAEFKQDGNFRMWMRAHQLRTYEWCSNWTLGEPFVLLWGSEIYWSLKQFLDRFENVLSNRREFNTFRLSPQLVQSFVRKLVAFRPVLVSTYSNAMHLIASEAERQGVRFEALRAVQGTSEPLPPAMGERIARALGCDTYDKYGMRESNIVAHESPRHEGMCIQSENVYVEFLDDAGQPCAPGQSGRVVVTTLNNLSMPLIRYETSDLAAPLEGFCPSGLGLPRMGHVAGRLQDLIAVPGGGHVDAYFFSYLFMRFPEIHWFQVAQTEPATLHIRMYTPEGLGARTRQELLERIRHHTGFPFQVAFEPLAAMPESATGKFRLCVSELPQERAALAPGAAA